MNFVGEARLTPSRDSRPHTQANLHPCAKFPMRPHNVPSNASAVNYISCDKTCCRLPPPVYMCRDGWV